MPVRHCTAAAAEGDRAVVLVFGGGALCFSFGSAFSQPCALHLPRSCLAAPPMPEASDSCCATGTALVEDQTEPLAVPSEDTAETHNRGSGARGSGAIDGSERMVTLADIINGESNKTTKKHDRPASNCGSSATDEPKTSAADDARSKDESRTKPCSAWWALVVPKVHAKMAKDTLKDMSSLDRSRLSLVCNGGASIALPVTAACADVLQQAMSGAHASRPDVQALAGIVKTGTPGLCRMDLPPAKVLQSPGKALREVAQALLTSAGALQFDVLAFYMATIDLCAILCEL